MNLIFVIITASAYIASSICYLHFFVTRKLAPEKVGAWFLLGGVISQTMIIIGQYSGLGRFPVIDLKESLCFFSWSLGVMFLAVRLRKFTGSLGTFTVPLVTVFFLVAAFVDPKLIPVDDRFKTFLFPLHILSTFAGYAAFTLAAGAGVMYLLLVRDLKSRKSGKFIERLPSIYELDEMIYHSLGLGFPLITLGLAVGAIWLHQIYGTFVILDVKIITSAFTWMLYAAVLHARVLAGWRGKKLAALSVIGYGLVLVTFIGVGLFSKGFHGFFRAP